MRNHRPDRLTGQNTEELMLTSYCLQVQSSAGGPRKYAGPVDVIRSLHKEGGLRSIFRGSAATAARGRSVLSMS